MGTRTFASATLPVRGKPEAISAGFSHWAPAELIAV